MDKNIVAVLSMYAVYDAPMLQYIIVFFCIAKYAQYYGHAYVLSVNIFYCIDTCLFRFISFGRHCPGVNYAPCATCAHCRRRAHGCS